MSFGHLLGCFLKMTKKSKLLFLESDWSFPMLEKAMDIFGSLSKELELNIYPNQIEIINSEQMLDAYASTGLPIMYRHWSFGKTFSREQDNYKKGKSGLAYEIVINSNPAISYLMEENTACTQVLVLAHAAFGHNHFFKNNYLFKMWTDASSIIDYLIFARDYIVACETKYGMSRVEKLLDSAHSLNMYSIDRYKHRGEISLSKEKENIKQREEYLQSQVNILWNKIPKKIDTNVFTDSESIFPKSPEENILGFIEKYSPKLEIWEREILRIVRQINQYFYPQSQTKMMNEGWACFTHFYMMHRLHDKGFLSDGNMLEFYKLHSGVLYQPDFDSKSYYGINPYKLGFEIFMDIKRMCLHPDDEDRKLFPELVDKPWLPVLLDAVENYRDDSFILQFLGPKVVEKLKLFHVFDDKNRYEYEIKNIHNLSGLSKLRSSLADLYDISRNTPKIEVTKANIQGNRELELTYFPIFGRSLDESYLSVLQHIERLWGYPVILKGV